MRKVYAVATAVLGLLLLVVLGAAPHELDDNLMAASRGGGAYARKCEESCLRYNNFHNQCPAGTGNCYSCTNATVSVFYLDVFPHCVQGNPGHKMGNGSYDCGLKRVGTCIGIGVCGNLSSLLQNCNDAQEVVLQP